MGVLIRQGVDTAKFMGLKGLQRALTKEWVGYAQIATPKTQASPPLTLGGNGGLDVKGIMKEQGGCRRIEGG
jgi:hypothetical protein